MKQEKKKQKEVAETTKVEKSANTVGTVSIGSRGRTFQGFVKKKFPKRVVIEFERPVYIRKYERYLKLKTKLHARLPESMEKEVNIGDLIQVRECRPLSKIIHFMVIKKIKSAENGQRETEKKEEEK